MDAYISSIDTTNPIGGLVYAYGKKEFHKGFLYGLLTGGICCYILYLA